ncbi:hypothetical protein E1B28_005055 [Marasmius oreades]|uniref:Uncharacterized protein n=1 Tax=Marasmius oreades TaxID=181124 RepID=A0A9P7UZU3_9AGAR|nr:uncharacterized protein E1B28_005055 [Marasmius oreades]KAG7097735.1 hypothetical protein E1B28_005055 [Marasmius oreades]
MVKGSVLDMVTNEREIDGGTLRSGVNPEEIYIVLVDFEAVGVANTMDLTSSLSMPAFRSRRLSIGLTLNRRGQRKNLRMPFPPCRCLPSPCGSKKKLPPLLTQALSTSPPLLLYRRNSRFCDILWETLSSANSEIYATVKFRVRLPALNSPLSTNYN